MICMHEQNSIDSLSDDCITNKWKTKYPVSHTCQSPQIDLEITQQIIIVQTWIIYIFRHTSSYCQKNHSNCYCPRSQPGKYFLLVWFQLCLQFYPSIVHYELPSKTLIPITLNLEYNLSSTVSHTTMTCVWSYERTELAQTPSSCASRNPLPTKHACCWLFHKWSVWRLMTQNIPNQGLNRTWACISTETRHCCRNQMVQIANAWSGELKGSEANVVRSFIIKNHILICLSTDWWADRVALCDSTTVSETWKPYKQSQFSTSLRTTSSTPLFNSIPFV